MQAVPAVILQHELGQILQDLLAVQSHELLPTDLIQGAMVSCRLTGVFPSFPSVLLSQDKSEVRGGKAVGKSEKGGEYYQTNLEGIRWEAEADPHLTVHCTTALQHFRRAQGKTEALTWLHAV